MSEKLVTASVSSKKTFNLLGEKTELFISFAAQQRIVTIYGGLENINLLYTDPLVQTQAVAVVICGKKFNDFETIEEIYAAIEDYTSEEVNEVVEWLQDYFLNFTITQAEKAAKTIKRTQSLMQVVQDA